MQNIPLYMSEQEKNAYTGIYSLCNALMCSNPIVGANFKSLLDEAIKNIEGGLDLPNKEKYKEIFQKLIDSPDTEVISAAYDETVIALGTDIQSSLKLIVGEYVVRAMELSLYPNLIQTGSI